MTMPAPDSQPGTSLDDRLYRIERGLTVASTGVMGAVVFLDVIHRMASRQRGLVMRFVGEDKAWANPLGTGIGLVVGLLVVFAALRTRGEDASGKTWARAAGITAAIYGGLQLMLWVMPNGLVWSQTFGLVLMLVVGLFGASMAAKDHRHLALDLGSKLWPKALLPIMQGIGNVVTGLFCMVFAGLAVVSLRDHFSDWNTDHAAGLFVALPIPKWAAFLPIPLAFFIMGVRFLVLARESFAGKVEDDDPMHMLGIDAPADDVVAAEGVKP